MASADSDAPAGLRGTAAQVLAVVRDRQLSLAAAGVAYYAFNALLPLLVLAVLAASRSGVVALAADSLARYQGGSPTDVRVVATAVRDGQGFWRLAGLAAGVAAWSAVQLGRAIADAFAAVYGDPGHSLAERAADVVVVVLTWVVALALVVALGVALAFVPRPGLVDAAWPAVLFVGLVAAFLPTYLVFPPAVSLREAAPGAALAAAVWTGSGLLFRAYAATATSVAFFGVVGGVLLLLTWLYVGSLALVAGAVTNAVLADALADSRT